MRQNFPIDCFFKEICGFLSHNKILIVIGETGSGKTTKLPLFLYFSGIQKNKSIICTQPRRVAAISVAKKISSDIKTRLGNEVGYSIRFEDVFGSKTRIKFMTDGVLLKELMKNPLLDKYSVIILDEMHERSLNMDLLLILCKNLVAIRTDLKLILTSATINLEKYSNFFQNCPIFSIPGRCFSVQIHYKTVSNSDHVFACYRSILNILKISTKGDILVFLTGRKDIDALGNLLFFFRQRKKNFLDFRIIPIFSTLPHQFQLYAAERLYPERKIILSTNVAETSLTIARISFVVDCGFVKQNLFNPYVSYQKLVVLPISRSSAIQRAGRAGRICVGRCYRIYTKWTYYNEMREFSVPEIQRINCSQIILFLKGLGLNNFFAFDWIDFPAKRSFIFSFKLLYSIGALNKTGKLTVTGRKMLEIPLEPMLAKTMICSHDYGCLYDFIIVVAMIVSSFPCENFLTLKKCFLKKSKHQGDQYFLLFVFLYWKKENFAPKWLETFRVNKDWVEIFCNIKSQLVKIAGKIFPRINKPGTKDGLIISFLSGHFLNVAKLKKANVYSIIFREKNMGVHIHPFSVMRTVKCSPILIFFVELFYNICPYVKIISGIKKKWLLSLANIVK